MKKIILTLLLPAILSSSSWAQTITFKNNTPLNIQYILAEMDGPINAYLCQSPPNSYPRNGVIPAYSKFTLPITTGLDAFGKISLREIGGALNAIQVQLTNPAIIALPCGSGQSSSLCPFSLPCFATWVNMPGTSNVAVYIQ